VQDADDGHDGEDGDPADLDQVEVIGGGVGQGGVGDGVEDAEHVRVPTGGSRAERAQPQGTWSGLG